MRLMRCKCTQNELQSIRALCDEPDCIWWSSASHCVGSEPGVNARSDHILRKEIRILKDVDLGCYDLVYGDHTADRLQITRTLINFRWNAKARFRCHKPDNASRYGAHVNASCNCGLCDVLGGSSGIEETSVRYFGESNLCQGMVENSIKMICF